MKFIALLCFITLVVAQNCYISTFSEHYDICSLVGQELNFTSGTNVWKVNVFGTVDNFEGCDHIPEYTSAVRRFSIVQGLYKCDYLSSSLNSVSSGVETSETGAKSIYVSYNGGDICNVDPTRTNEVITHFVCNPQAIIPSVYNVKLDYNTCITEFFVYTNASCSSTLSTTLIWIIGVVIILIVALILGTYFGIQHYRKVQAEIKKSQNKQALL